MTRPSLAPRPIRPLTLLIVPLWILMGASTASAGIFGPRPLCVTPKGSYRCFSSIQQAIQQVQPGGRIEVAAGMYREQLLIPSSKGRIRIVGAEPSRKSLSCSPTVIDVSGLAGDAVSIQAARVTLEHLTIRNVDRDGIDVSAPEAKIESVCVERTSRGDCIDVNSAGAGSKILRSRLRHCDDDGIDLDSAHGTEVAYTEISNVKDEDGIDADGNDYNLHHNRIGRVEEECINLDGDRASITSNTLDLCGDDGVDATGARVYVAYNSAESIGELVDKEEIPGDGAPSIVREALKQRHGIVVDSDKPIVYSNYVNGALGDGIDVTCDDGGGDCKGGHVSRNTVRRVMDGSVRPDDLGLVQANHAIVFEAPAGDTRSACAVDSNHTERNADDGIVVMGNGISVSRNRALHNGGGEVEFLRTGPADGIRVVGDDNWIDWNDANGNDDDGIEVRGQRNVLRWNRTNENTGSGIEVADGGTSGTRLERNEAHGNTRSGIAILEGVAATRVDDNEARGNRADFCDEGVGTISRWNDFGSTATDGCEE